MKQISNKEYEACRVICKMSRIDAFPVNSEYMGEVYFVYDNGTGAAYEKHQNIGLLRTEFGTVYP